MEKKTRSIFNGVAGFSFSISAVVGISVLCLAPQTAGKGTTLNDFALRIVSTAR